MITFIKKKLSYIAIIFFIVISIQNLSKFNDIDMINIENDIDNSNPRNESGDLSIQDELLDKDYIKLQKYELTKKILTLLTNSKKQMRVSMLLTT